MLQGINILVQKVYPYSKSVIVIYIIVRKSKRMSNKTKTTENPTMQPKETSDSSSTRNNTAMGVNSVNAGESTTSMV